MPAGGLSPYLSPDEVARRELLEEVCGIVAEPHRTGRSYTSYRISSEVASGYLAKGLELGETMPEPPSVAPSSRRGLVEMRWVPDKGAQRITREGEVFDGPNAPSLLWCESLLIGDLHLDH